MNEMEREMIHLVNIILTAPLMETLTKAVRLNLQKHLKDEFTLSRDEHLKIKKWQLESRKAFAADIQAITTKQNVGVSMVIAIRKDPQFVQRLQKRGHSIE